MSKINKIILWIIAIIIIVALIWLGYSEKEPVVEGEVIKIGAILPLSGNSSEWGEITKRGIDLAIEEVNEKEKILEVIFEDSGPGLNSAVSSVYKLIDIDNVKVLMCQLSDVCGAIAPIAQEKNIVLFGFTDNPNFTETGNFIFNIRGNAILMGNKLGEYTKDKYKKVAVFYLNNPTQKGVFDGFEEVFQKEDREILFSESHNKDDLDFKTSLAKVKEEDINTLLFLSRTNNVVNLIKQSTELGIDKPIISGPGIDTKGFIESVGELAENIVYPTSIVSYDIENEKLQTALKKYEEIYNESMPMWVAESYDTINLLKFIVDNGNFSSPDIRNALVELDNFQGLSNNNIVFDDNRSILKEYKIFQIKEGKFVPYQPQ